MKNDSHNDLLFLDKIDSVLTFWRRQQTHRIVGPSGDGEYLYREGDRRLWVCVEWLSEESGLDMIVYKDSVNQWDPPYDQEIISEAKRQEILDRVGEYLRKGKARFQFQ